MGGTVSLIGLYFTLIGFISGLFFTRIDSWYGSVRSFHGSLDSLEERSEYRSAKTQVLGLKASIPTGSFASVGILLSALTCLSFYVPVERSPVDPLLFVHLPVVVTVGAYWLGGGVLLRRGHSHLLEAEEKVDEGLRG
jgi:hypothetical protein